MSLQEAADRVGVHYQTAYRWVREGTLPAVKVGGAYVVEPADIEALATARDSPRPAPAVIRIRDWNRQTERFYDALLTGDERTASGLVARLQAGGVGIVDVLERVMVPALRRLGEGWTGGAVSIAEEHRGTAICERLLGSTSRVAGRPRGVVVVTTPAGDRHGLPALMAAAALRERHWRVHHLGADMPVEDLADFAHNLGADLCVVSLTHPPAAAAAAEAAKVLTRRGLRVLLGRPGATLNELLTAAEQKPPAPTSDGDGALVATRCAPALGVIEDQHARHGELGRAVEDGRVGRDSDRLTALDHRRRLTGTAVVATP